MKGGESTGTLSICSSNSQKRPVSGSSGGNRNVSSENGMRTEDKKPADGESVDKDCSGVKSSGIGNDGEESSKGKSGRDLSSSERFRTACNGGPKALRKIDPFNAIDTSREQEFKPRGRQMSTSKPPAPNVVAARNLRKENLLASK